ncbi:hypothetical protein KW851_13360 [Pseudomonas sp. PDM33]|uniref:hypothetical protein n=1 Tax=Pseudomonas sp. PDM33 TaxID=2854765 RepID=UPI001C43F902|nr:hypothetical protein [Pseudomonas sp. PDM33]MBV7583812.1 hypothetical protein [Pseudomonas sp. PDM33]
MKIKYLQRFEDESGDQAGDSLAALHWLLRRLAEKKIAEVVDSEFDRCRIRLPLMRRFPSLKRKRLSRKEIFENKA